MTRLFEWLKASPEAVVTAVALLVGLAGLLAGLPLVLPDAFSLGFVEQHYVGPVLVAVLLQVALVALRRRRIDGGARVRAAVASLSMVTVSILVHFNLKAWMPLVHPRLFDDELMRLDRIFGDLVPLIIALRRALASVFSRFGLSVDPLYHGCFVALFFVAFAGHAAFDSVRGLRRLVIGTCLVLLLGGLCYWVLPAKGPFVFRVSESRLADAAQAAMEAKFDAFARTRVPPPGYFVAPLAAMPSLHAAHTTFFTISAYRRVRPLFWPFALALLWIMLEAVASGWHYVVDLPAGVGLAFGCVWLADWALPDT